MARAYKLTGRPYTPETKVLTPDTKVTASPTDPIAKVAGPADNIYTTLNSFINAGTEMVRPMAADAKEEGALAARSAPDAEVGKEGATNKPVLFGDAYMAGYYKIDGEARAAQYHREASDFTEKNKDLMEPGDFHKGMAEIRAKYAAGIVDKNQERSFLPKAAEVDDAVNREIDTAQRKKLHGATIEKGTQVSRVNIETRMLKHLVPLGIGSIAGMGTAEGLAILGRNPQVYKEIAAEMVAEQGAFVAGNAATHTKAEATETFLNNLINIAVATKNPDILNAVFTPNSEGKMIADYNDTKGNNIGKHVTSLQQTIAGEQYTQTRQRELREKEAKEEAGRLVLMGFSQMGAKIGSMTSPEEKAAALTQYEQDVIATLARTDIHLTPGQMADMVTTMQTRLKAGSDYHPHKTSNENLAKFWWAYRTGEANVAWVNKNSRLFDAGDFERFIALAGQDEHADRKTTKEKTFMDGRFQLKEEYDSIPKMWNPIGPFGRGPYDRAGDQKAQRAQKAYREAVEDYAEQNGGKNPGKEARAAIMDKIRNTPGLEPYVRAKPEVISKLIEKMLADGRLPPVVPEDRWGWIEKYGRKFVTGPELEAMEAYIGGPGDVHRAGADHTPKPKPVGQAQGGK